MPATSKSAPAVKSPVAEVPAPVPHASGARTRLPLSMSQQRFLLSVLAVVALLGSLAFVATVKMDGDVKTAIIAIIGTSLVGQVKDAFRHYFPGGQADQPSSSGK